MAAAKHRAPKRSGASKLVRKLLSFASIGTFVMAIGLGVMFYGTEVAHLSENAAYAIQAFVSIELNFLLNYKFTWGKKGKTKEELALREKFGPALVKFHLTKLFTVPLNQVLFGLMMLYPAMPWIAAYVICVAITSTLMYVAADEIVFRRGRWPKPRDLWPFGRKKAHVVIQTDAASTINPSVIDADETSGSLGKLTFTEENAPWFSVVIPTKNGGQEVAETARALLNQDYPGKIEVIVVADPDDPVREHLAPLLDRVKLYEAHIVSPGRDSNTKRDIGLHEAHPASTILAVMDADVIPEPDWASTVAKLIQDGADAAAGPVSGLGDSFWCRYIDKVPVGRKMPDNVDADFVLDSKTIARRKPMVTANFALSRKAYELAGGPNRSFTNSYEDYEWMSRMVQRGLRITCTKSLACQRYHREGLKALKGEYLRSGKGCADHVYTHFRGCGFARKRMRQLVVFYLMFGAIGAALVFALLATLAAGVALTLALVAHSFWKVRRPEALVYPLITLLLGWMFIRGFTGGLFHRYIGQKALVQPTVHRYGIVMAHSRKVSTEDTLALHTVTAPAEAV